jgi:hypothetical protein
MNKETQEPMAKERLAALREWSDDYCDPYCPPSRSRDLEANFANAIPELLNEIERLNKVVEQAVRLGRMDVGRDGVYVWNRHLLYTDVPELFAHMKAKEESYE